jgi:hypothetical protein
VTDVLTPLGALSIGASIPGPAAAMLSVTPTLQAQFDAIASFSPTVNPPTFDADAAVAADIGASIATSLGLHLTPPSVAVQVQVALDANAAIALQISGILAITNLFATAGMFGYSYDGQWSGLASSLPAALPGGNPGDHCNAILLVTTDGVTWTAMSTVFRVS